MAQKFVMLPKSEYNELNLKLDEILSKLNSSGIESDEIIGNKWIPEKKAQELTGKKGTTLWKMRNKGLLTYTKLNNRVYYDIESIMALLEKNKREAYNKQIG